jgi:hypothetical protein
LANGFDCVGVTLPPKGFPLMVVGADGTLDVKGFGAWNGLG